MGFKVSELLLFDLVVIAFNGWLAIRASVSDHHFWLCVACVAIGVGLVGVYIEVREGFKRRPDRP